MFTGTLFEYRTMIRNKVLSSYLKNDKAHRIDHADEVVDLAIEMTVSLNLDVCLKEVIVAGYAHDMFACEKHLHHKLASEYINNHGGEFCEGTLDVWALLRVAAACYQHRSSWHGAYDSTLACLIASADRGVPNLNEKIIRTYKGVIHRMEHDKAIEYSVNHVKEKFGTDSKIRYPSIYQSYFEKELADMLWAVDNLTAEDVEVVIGNEEIENC